jgi:hypothetical protein
MNATKKRNFTKVVQKKNKKKYKVFLPKGAYIRREKTVFFRNGFYFTGKKEEKPNM